MDQTSASSIVTKIGIAVLIIALVDLFYLNYWVINSSKISQDNRELSEASLEPESTPSPSVVPSPSVEPVEKIVETKTIVEKEVQTVIQNAQKEIFIPIGSGSLTDRSWATLPGLEVTIDTTKYGTIESITFEATLWPEGGNGKAYARIINVTDTNPFIESEITSSTAAGSLHSSSSIPFPSGSKKYGIQAKSDVENFAAHVENARIKITLR